MAQRPRATLRALIANWRGYEAPFLHKLRLALGNTWTKLHTHSGCCGHPGQPGC